MKKKFKDFHEAFHFCGDHPFFNTDVLFNPPIIEVVKVHPKLNCVVNDVAAMNTKTRVWLEWGPIGISEKMIHHSHDIDLDVGADTYEEAIIKLANKVLQKYGYYDTVSDEWQQIQEAFTQARHLEINDRDKLIDLSFRKRGWKKAIKYYVQYRLRQRV